MQASPTEQYNRTHDENVSELLSRDDARLDSGTLDFIEHTLLLFLIAHQENNTNEQEDMLWKVAKLTAKFPALYEWLGSHGFPEYVTDLPETRGDKNFVIDKIEAAAADKPQLMAPVFSLHQTEQARREGRDPLQGVNADHKLSMTFGRRLTTAPDPAAASTKVMPGDAAAGTKAMPDAAAGTKAMPDAGTKAMPDDAAAGTKAMPDDAAAGTKAMPDDAAAGTKAMPDAAAGAKAMPVEDTIPLLLSATRRAPKASKEGYLAQLAEIALSDDDARQQVWQVCGEGLYSMYLDPSASSDLLHSLLRFSMDGEPFERELRDRLMIASFNEVSEADTDWEESLLPADSSAAAPGAATGGASLTDSSAGSGAAATDATDKYGINEIKQRLMSGDPGALNDVFKLATPDFEQFHDALRGMREQNLALALRMLPLRADLTPRDSALSESLVKLINGTSSPAASATAFAEKATGTPSPEKEADNVKGLPVL